jgi:hypothetical protein
MSVLGLQAPHGGAASLESSLVPAETARAQDVYAAWKAVFEGARPARPGAAQLPHDPETALRGDSGADATAHHGCNDLGPESIMPPASARTSPIYDPAVSTDSTRVRVSTPAPRDMSVEVSSVSPGAASDAPGSPASEVAVRFHYVRPVGAPLDGPPPAEVVSVVLEGNDVSIFVRDSGLTESEALRTAFQTARELTGRSTSLQQLTLNGRVLYQQPTLAYDARPGDVLFSC